MKNRIIWIFEEETPRLSTPPGSPNENLSLESKNTNNLALPWTLFGKLGESERDALTEIYRAACRHAGDEDKEHDRFKRLLLEMELRDWDESY